MGELFSLGESLEVSAYVLSYDHDIRLLVVRTLLTYLELDGYLEGGTPFYSSYQFKPLATSAEILARFEGQRRDFLATVFRHARKGRTWFTIDVQQTATAIGAPRDRVVRALDYLGEQRLLEIKATGVRLRYQRLKPPADLDALAQSLHGRMLDRERADLARLLQVIDLVTHDGCQVSSLGGYFGQPLDGPCGHCSWCLDGRQPKSMTPRTAAKIDEHLWQQALALRDQHPQLLSQPRSLARFLCGVTSPRIVRARLSRDRLFGALGHVPFQEVLQRATSE